MERCYLEDFGRDGFCQNYGLCRQAKCCCNCIGEDRHGQPIANPQPVSKQEFAEVEAELIACGYESYLTWVRDHREGSL